MRTWVIASFPFTCGFHDTHRIQAGEWFLEIRTGGAGKIRRCTACASRTYGEFPPGTEAPELGEPAPEEEPAREEVGG